MSVFKKIRNRFAPVQPLPEGMLHMEVAPQDAPPYRLHLRMNPDGSGVLILNASTVMHLNPTATEYAYHLIKGSSDEDAAKAIASRYRVNKEQALADFRDFVDRIQSLITTNDLDPTMPDFERVRPYETDLSAPLRLDCALTYRLPEGVNPQIAPSKRVTRELSTDEWNTILDKAWAVGIPHVTFTGGEPTLRDDLVALIAHAESNGQVAGLLTDGLKLADSAYLETLLQAGLDHILFLLDPENDFSWQALENCMKADIFVTVHLTLDGSDQQEVRATLVKLAGLEVKSLSLSASHSGTNVLADYRNYIAELGMSLVWDLPVPYGQNNPISEEIAEMEPSANGAGKAWLYVEPDGDVLPSQGQAGKVLGNILNDEWTKIYK